MLRTRDECSCRIVGFSFSFLASHFSVLVLLYHMYFYSFTLYCKLKFERTCHVPRLHNSVTNFGVLLPVGLTRLRYEGLRGKEYLCRQIWWRWRRRRR